MTPINLAKSLASKRKMEKAENKRFSFVVGLGISLVFFLANVLAKSVELIVLHDFTVISWANPISKILVSAILLIILIKISK